VPHSLTPIVLPSEDPTEPDHAARAGYVDAQDGWGLAVYREFSDIKVWTGSPGYSTVASLALGRIQFNAIYLQSTAQTLSTMNFTFTNTPTSLTSGQNFVGLYNSVGEQMAVSDDQTTAFGSSGLKSVSFTSPYMASPGVYYLAILANGTGTAPQIVCHGATGSSIINFGMPAGEWRCMQSSGTHTTLPASLTLASQNASAINYTAIIT
jgi:hypothetical protein